MTIKTACGLSLRIATQSHLVPEISKVDILQPEERRLEEMCQMRDVHLVVVSGWSQDELKCNAPKVSLRQEAGIPSH